MFLLSLWATYIDAIIKDPSLNWRFTCFYGNPKVLDRSQSWPLLSRLSSINSLSWIIGGDFNEIMSQNLKKKGGNLRNFHQMEDFHSAVDSCNLMDPGFKGHKYTWKRIKENKVPIWERLDRFFNQYNFHSSFHYLFVSHLGFYSSDHRMIMASWNMSTRPAIKRKSAIPRFEVNLAHNEEGKNIVADALELHYFNKFPVDSTKAQEKYKLS